MEYTDDPNDLTKAFRYRQPEVSMTAPIPDELLRHLPPWVSKLQKVAYWLMLPFAIVMIVGTLGEALGLWL